MAQKTVACILRNTGSGWYVLNDSGHAPVGVSGLVQNADSLTLNFDFSASKINTFLIAPDETFAQSGLAAGASVGGTKAIIKFGKNGVAWSPGQIASDSGNFWVFGLFDSSASAEPPTEQPPVEQPPPPTSSSLTFIENGIFTVPDYENELVVEIWGAGAGAHGDTNGQPGTDGGDTTFDNLVARGGKKGMTSASTGGGLGGTASGGAENVPGQRGGNGSNSGPSGKGGDAPDGGVGGASVKNGPGKDGQAPGGGGSGGDNGTSAAASGGGSGARVKRRYAKGELVPGTQMPVEIGAPGASGTGGQRGGKGARGEARFSW